MDFASNQLSNRTRFRELDIVDDYWRGMAGQLVSVFSTGNQVDRFLSDKRFVVGIGEGTGF